MFLYLQDGICIILVVGMIVALIEGVVGFKTTLSAHRTFVRTLASSAEADELFTLRERLINRGSVDIVELQQLTTSLQAIANTLPEKQRKVIDRCLFQDSLRGRVRYAQSALEKAGIGRPLPPGSSPFEKELRT